MADPTTTNKFLAKPNRGTDIDTWAPAMNNNALIMDNSLGGTTTVALTSANVTLLSSQYQCVFLRFTGALTASVTVTLPAVGSFYTVVNDVTNSSAFTVTLQTTASGSRHIGIPPATTDIMTDGVHVRFRNLPPPGSYWVHSGSSVPAWVSACSVPPWIYCNGTAFSSATYPVLATLLNGTTPPDLRGRIPAFVDDGAGNITGGTFKATAGNQNITLDKAHLPNINFTVTDPGHSHAIASNNAHTGSRLSGTFSFSGGGINGATITVNPVTTGITVASGGSGTAFATMPPSIVGGITMIRAA